MTGFNSKREAAADKQHWNEDEWRRNNWRCGHGWLRGEQCESCNAPQPPSEWTGIKAILDEYGLQAIDFVADFKAALAQPAQEPVREALKLALDALEESQTDNDTMEFWDRKSKAITAIKVALAQPPQRTWVGLTEDELLHIGVATGLERAAAQMIEAKLKEKNNGT